MKKWRMIVAAALASSAWTAPAGAVSSDVVVKIVLDEPEHYAEFGTGVVVRDYPPIVATCAHVIKDRSAVYVYVESEGPRGRFFPVSKARAWFEDDIAFLLVDDFAGFTEAATWDTGYAFPSQRNQVVDVDLLGYSRRSGELLVRGRLRGMPSTLRALGTFPPWVPGGDILRVVELDTHQGNGMIGWGGDSGAPVLVDNKVVALVAGAIDPHFGYSRRIPFVVPLKHPVPEKGEMKPLPLSWEVDPYADAPVLTSIWRPKYADVKANARFQPCVAPIEVVMGQYRGSRDKLPSSLEGSPSPECQALYAGLRRDAIIEELDTRVGREAFASATAMGATATASPKERKERDEALKRILERDENLKKNFEKLLELGRGVEPPTPVAPSSEAQKLLDLAAKYKQSAAEARKRQEDLLRSGVAPQGATPPGR